MKIIAACGNGMGTSMIIKQKVEAISNKLNLGASVEAMSVGQAKSMIGNADIIITSTHLANQFSTSEKAKIIGVKNLMDEKEIKAALTKAIK